MCSAEVSVTITPIYFLFIKKWDKPFFILFRPSLSHGLTQTIVVVDVSRKRFKEKSVVYISIVEHQKVGIAFGVVYDQVFKQN